MQRNKIIYCLADAALVVSSDVNKGGTWAGAIEQLERFKSRAVYVRTNFSASEGNRELQSRGALPWPQPETGDELKQLLKALIPSSAESIADSRFPLFAMENH